MAKDDQAAVETEGGGGNKKLFIIIGAAVAVAVILGAVVFMLGGKGDKKDKGKDEAKVEGKAETKAEGAKGGEAGGKEGAAASNIYPLEPFIVNIYDGQELRYLKVKVEMEMVGVGVKAEIDARLAPIRDSILVLLSAKTLQDVQDVQGKNQLKEEILGAINKVLPPGKVAKIYFTDFVVQ
ncbi:flagellar basal body protein FliL [Geobacter sp. FeAm09]|uniref:flagellar basal body-associated FliL family protein n=1 Tax=Geobacter sp. FeAm09 TaxID=2597769 RepID=UPI0011ED00EA|nr:flagellar basal body-associated FliL family protein [Geobacter sp. FeAm09]QEM69878.1 flagellar basal body protein FliL [Geobacter sp. FeAm09]